MYGANRFVESTLFSHGDVGASQNLENFRTRRLCPVVHYLGQNLKSAGDWDDYVLHVADLVAARVPLTAEQLAQGRRRRCRRCRRRYIRRGGIDALSYDFDEPIR